jgi:anti-sigma B factor antagonist
VTALPPTPEGYAGSLGIESLIVDGQVILRLRGELDLSSAEIFADAARHVHAEGVPVIVLDASALEFIDSSGLRQLVVALKRQREIGGDVVLRAPTDRTRRLLEIVGLDNIFTIAADTEVAAAADSGHSSTPEGDPGFEHPHESRPPMHVSVEGRAETDGS